MSPPVPERSPSSWKHRLLLAALALLGLLVALYLALFQWRVFPTVFEPFFGEGSRQILLESWVARILPVPDAFLGMLGYLAELVLTLVGGHDRWRTHPWIVLSLGGVLGLMAAGSILLVIAQPLLFGAWCTLCLVSAAISLGLAALGAPEVLATIRHVRAIKSAGHPAN